MTAPFMRAYTELLVTTCHQRGAHAIGGMAAFIPSRRDPEVNAMALAKVREDKTRESADGFDGSWVAHPDLVPLCREVFDARPRRPAQPARPAARRRQRVRRRPARGRARPRAPSPRPGCATTSASALQYLASWLGGNGAVAIFNLMEDAATAEISRSQVWQWIHNDIRLDDGQTVTQRSGRADHRRGARRAIREAAGRRPSTRPRFEQAAALFSAGRAGRRLRGLPHPARLRGDAVAAPGTDPSSRKQLAVARAPRGLPARQGAPWRVSAARVAPVWRQR